MKSLPFAILEPVLSSPRIDSFQILSGVSDFRDLAPIWEGSTHEVMALDFETNGKPPYDPEGRVVGVALSDSRGSVYIDFLSASAGALRFVLEGLSSANIPIIAHNMFFDAAWCEREGIRLNWHACTLATTRHLANEGWLGQTYGLKSLQLDLLGWKESNEHGIDSWLVEHGYISNISKAPKEGYYPVTLHDEARWASPLKQEMWRVPADILGEYACQDADACWQLWSYVLSPKLEVFLELKDWMTDLYPEYILLLIEQELRGVLIDKDFLLSYKDELVARTKQMKANLFDTFREQCDLWNQQHIDEVKSRQPEQYLKVKELGPEPKKYNKNDQVTARWLRWEHARVLRSSPEWTPPISKQWTRWQEEFEQVQAIEHFNWNSGQQRAWLFYGQLGYPVKILTDKEQPSTGEEALMQFGPGGKMLIELMGVEKEISSVESLLEKLGPTSLYHPELRVPGTYTGRLGGSGGYNYQNIPKSPLMQAFVARPGFLVVSCDIAALENVVLAERSRDESLWALYGPGSAQNDSYLFNGAQLPIIGDIIKATGYDPYNPTPESISRAKKECKKERSIAKTITLGYNYGAGPGKLFETLSLQGIDVTFEQCETIHLGFQALYKGAKSHEKKLYQQWSDNRGWFLNGLGHPSCVDWDKRKDIGNRDAQSTGHSIFVLFLMLTIKRAREAGLEVYPWNADVHDCWYIEVKEDQAKQLEELVIGSILPEWNNILGGDIPHKAEPAIITNLYLDKVEQDVEAAKDFAAQQRKRLASWGTKVQDKVTRSFVVARG